MADLSPRLKRLGDVIAAAVSRSIAHALGPIEQRLATIEMRAAQRLEDAERRIAELERALAETKAGNVRRVA